MKFRKKQLYNLMAIYSPAVLEIQMSVYLRNKLLYKIRKPCRSQLNFDLSDQISSVIEPSRTTTPGYGGLNRKGGEE